MKPRRSRFIFMPFGIAAFVFLAGGAVMLLWNNVLVAAVPVVHAVTYWQALGLLVLCKILFGFGPRPGGFGGRDRMRAEQMRHLRQHMEHMSDEEREQFKERMRRRFGRHHGESFQSK